MKKYILGALLLAIVTAAVIFTQLYTAASVDKMHSLADRVEEAVKIEDYECALELVDEMVKYFKTSSKIMSAYTPHVRLDEIVLSLQRLKAYVENQSQNDSLAEIYNILTRLNIILHEEKISFENIL